MIVVEVECANATAQGGAIDNHDLETECHRNTYGCGNEPGDSG